MRSNRLALLYAAIALALSAPIAATVHAVEPAEVLPDAALEKRARALSTELRCLVCQNQSIDDSNAPLARDLRVLVRERLVAGDSDRQVMDFVVARYGEFVLLRPPFGLHTLILWLAPLLVLAAAAWWIVGRLRTPKAITGPVTLSAEERRRLDALLAEQDGAGTEPRR